MWPECCADGKPCGNEIALKYDPKNHVLQYCMASNISGVIGSAVAAGVLISFLG